MGNVDDIMCEREMPIKRQGYVCHDYCPLPIVDYLSGRGIMHHCKPPCCLPRSQIETVTIEIRDVIVGVKVPVKKPCPIMHESIQSWINPYLTSHNSASHLYPL